MLSIRWIGTLPWQPILCIKKNKNHVRFFQFLHHMKALWVYMIDLKFFFNTSMYVAMATNGQNYLPPALIALSFRNGMRYQNRNMRVNSPNDASILCENFIKFGPVTPELTLLICECQLRHGQKRILDEYLQI